jgi:hypothetical protein
LLEKVTKYHETLKHPNHPELDTEGSDSSDSEQESVDMDLDVDGSWFVQAVFKGF